MTIQQKIYIGVGISAIIAFGILAGSSWSNYKIGKLEKEVTEVKTVADASQEAASMKEIEAAEYKQKIEYLEYQLTLIQTIARKQDEELEKLNTNSRTARDGVERAKRTRAINATADELCAKLAELGYPCA